jgi:hypothetical protein
MTREHALEDLVVSLQIPEERVRQQVAAAPSVTDRGAVPVHEHQPLRLANRQPPQQRLVDQGKDGRVRAHPEADRKNGNRGERAVPQQPAQGVSQVVAEEIEHRANLRRQHWNLRRRRVEQWFGCDEKGYRSRQPGSVKSNACEMSRE